MSGYDEGVVEYGDNSLVDQYEKKTVNTCEREKKIFLDFIQNFRRGREAYYMYVIYLM